MTANGTFAQLRLGWLFWACCNRLSLAPLLLGSLKLHLQVPVRGAGHPELAYLPHEGGLARPTAPIPQMECNELGPSEVHGNANVPDHSGIPPRLELPIRQRAPAGHDGPPGR